MIWGRAIPALPVADIGAAVALYTDLLCFRVLYRDDGLAVLRRDDAELHLWLAADTAWHGRSDIAEQPVRSGAESFLAGTASCRIGLDSPADVDTLYEELKSSGSLHGASTDGPMTTERGTRELHVVDLDGNLLTFYASA